VKVRLRTLTLVGILLGLLIVSGSSAARHRQVPLTLVITGHGGVRLSDGRQFGCGTSSCKRKVLVRAGSRITLKAMPARLWAFSSWTGACRATTPKCTLRLRRAATVSVKLLPPGASSANPIPLGVAAVVRKVWSMKVVSVTPNANDQVLAACNYDPNCQTPPGAQEYMAGLSVTYKGGGSAGVGIGLIGLVETIGSHRTSYDTNTTPCPGPWPAPSFRYTEQKVFSGQTVSGNVCYQIAHNDADSLVMFVYSGENDSQKVWFALR
jgi:hypothetical protein